MKVFKLLTTILAKRRVAKDLEITLSRTFDRLSAASRKEELLEKRFDVSAALASCMGAIRDTYPGAIVEEESMAIAYLEANAIGQSDDIDPLLEAIMQLVRECPQTLNDRTGVVAWLIAPKMAQRMRDQGLV